ncbi:hypothetical protein X757_03285 [Mesorhizobium sp. LSHC414A00]|nr:hypothetical protein X757_03285 [Mesorhizobium sp. LSHC414A00]
MNIAPDIIDLPEGGCLTEETICPSLFGLYSRALDWSDTGEVNYKSDA